MTVAKADGAVQQLADGTWSISYEVVVTNTSADAADHLLADRRPGVRLQLHGPLAGLAGRSRTSRMSPIEGGGTDTYTYVVTAEANETPVDPTALVCSPTDGGGFFNTRDGHLPRRHGQRHRMRRPGDARSCRRPRCPSVQDTDDRRMDAELRGVGVEPDRRSRSRTPSVTPRRHCRPV